MPAISALVSAACVGSRPPGWALGALARYDRPVSEVVREGDVVAIHYKLQSAEGEVVDSSQQDGPVEIVAGAPDVIPGLSRALIGMRLGEQRTIQLRPEDAFGVRPAVERRVPLSALPDGAREGVLVRMTMSGVRATLWIARIEGHEAVLTPEHPLAGQALQCDVFVAAIGGGERANLEP